MEYKFKSGVTYKRLCKGVLKQLESGDTLLFSCNRVVLNVNLNNGFITANIESSTNNLTKGELKYLEKSMNLNGYFGSSEYLSDNAYKTLKGWFNSYLISERTAFDKLNNVDVTLINNETLTELVICDIDDINARIIRECYRQGADDGFVLGDSDIIDYNQFNVEYVSRNGINELFSLIDICCVGNIIAVYSGYNRDLVTIYNKTNYDNIHAEYKATLNKVILLDLICFAFIELASITIISSWSHSRVITKILKNHVNDITDIWFNWWLDYFISLEIKTLKIRLGLLNRKLNKEIEFNECFTVYADDLSNDRVIVLNRLMHLIK